MENQSQYSYCLVFQLAIAHSVYTRMVEAKNSGDEDDDNNKQETSKKKKKKVVGTKKTSASKVIQSTSTLEKKSKKEEGRDNQQPPANADDDREPSPPPPAAGPSFSVRQGTLWLSGVEPGPVVPIAAAADDGSNISRSTAARKRRAERGSTEAQDDQVSSTIYAALIFTIPNFII